MKEISGDLWEYYEKQEFLICITTNGFVKANGEAVCGRGCAKEATKQIPGFARLLGSRLKQYGNAPGIMRTSPDEWGVFIFPVKHNWWEEASSNLILAGAHALFEQAQANPNTTFVLPRPGCGNGKLKWDDVKPLIEFLPDNVWIIDFLHISNRNQ